VTAARETNDIQVPDDPILLERMMEDLKHCDDLYKPTNYWSYYEKLIMPELKHQGLEDFRRRCDSMLEPFCGIDLLLKGRIRVKGTFRGVHRINTLLNRLVNGLPFLVMELSGGVPLWITPYFYWHVKEKFDKIGLALSQCPASRFGNPEDLQEIDGGLWSTMHLQYCALFADAARYIGFKPDSVVCELGAGMGRNIEVMAHLFKEATFLIFDIPPQLYVSNQYLQKVFGSRVLPYSEAISLTPDKEGKIAGSIRGRIIILPSWRMPDWSGTKVDIFWNSASFQEMEPDVVSNYLRLVCNMKPEWIYINARPKGCSWGEWKPGKGGTKTPVLEEHYIQALRDRYSLQTAYPSDFFMRTKDYESYVFRRQ